MIEVDNDIFELVTQKTARQDYWEKRLSEVTDNDRECQARQTEEMFAVFRNVASNIYAN